MSPSRDSVSLLVARRKQPVIRVNPDVLVWEAARIMARADVGAVIVVRGPGSWGVLSERDIARNVVARGLDPAQIRVADAMLEAAPRVSSTATVEAVMAYLALRERRHAVVTRGETLLGVISLGELARHTTAALEGDIEELARYVARESGPPKT